MGDREVRNEIAHSNWRGIPRPLPYTRWEHLGYDLIATSGALVLSIVISLARYDLKSLLDRAPALLLVLPLFLCCAGVILLISESFQSRQQITSLRPRTFLAAIVLSVWLLVADQILRAPSGTGFFFGNTTIALFCTMQPLLSVALRRTIDSPSALVAISARSVIIFAVGGIGVVSALRGYTGQLLAYGEPYYLISYSNGFIRRGVVGTLFSVMEMPITSLREVALISHLMFSALLGLLLLIWGISVSRKQFLIIFTALLLFATSQFLPTLIFDAGFLDPYIYLFLVVAAYALTRGQYAVAAATASFSPFIHESFVFYWLTVVLVVIKFKLNWRSGLVLIAPSPR
jgi:hypothetical protein